MACTPGVQGRGDLLRDRAASGASRKLCVAHTRRLALPPLGLCGLHVWRLNWPAGGQVGRGGGKHCALAWLLVSSYQHSGGGGELLQACRGEFAESKSPGP